MIALLTGTLVQRDGNRAIVDVGGVGYEVQAPGRVLDGWGTDAAVVVHVSTLERRAFQALLAVSGIGPKMALAALDAFTVDELTRAVESDDVVSLSRISGVGRKTAQRMALDLKGKLPVSMSPPAGARVPRPPADPLPLALAQLDYGKSEIDRALDGLTRQGITADAPLQDRLRAALKFLSGS